VVKSSRHNGISPKGLKLAPCNHPPAPSRCRYPIECWGNNYFGPSFWPRGYQRDTFFDILSTAKLVLSRLGLNYEKISP
jgi:hypothetical protein